MYLSRVEIDKSNRENMRKLNHVGAYHDWIEQAFPGEIERGERSRKLWRIDCLAGKSYLLLLSEIKPNQKQLERYGVIGSFASKDYNSFLSAIQQGEQYRFRVTLNPVHSILEEGRKRGKVYPLYSEKDQLRFLLERAPKHGFLLTESDFMIVEKGKEKLLKKGSRHIELIKVVYEGVLTVKDLMKFKDMLIHGMGREKAYGFGMMTVIKVK